MFVGCGCGLVWPRKYPKEPGLGADLEASHIIQSVEGYIPEGRTKLSRLFKVPSSAGGRSTAPSPQHTMMEDGDKTTSQGE